MEAPRELAIVLLDVSYHFLAFDRFVGAYELIIVIYHHWVEVAVRRWWQSVEMVDKIYLRNNKTISDRSFLCSSVVRSVGLLLLSRTE